MPLCGCINRESCFVDRSSPPEVVRAGACLSIQIILQPVKDDAFVKKPKPHFPVIPAKAGILEKQGVLDPGFRRGDDHWDFLP
jgi:hypothetical protein